MSELHYKINKYQYKFDNATSQENQVLYSNKLNYYKKLSNTKGGSIHIMKPKTGISKDYTLTDYLDDPLKIQSIGFGSMILGQPLEQVTFERHAPGPHEVAVKIQYAGVCHSDWHYLVGEWGSSFPLIPGHEIAGIVVRIGQRAKRFSIGDRVAVGTYTNSCRKCPRCKDGNEQYCENGATWTYDGFERKPGDIEPTGDPTYGGFSNIIVANENYVYKIPDNMQLDTSAPLLCAGLTTYSPLRQMNVDHGSRIGIAGIGGLGHIAVKLARAMGAYVVALTTSKWKLTDAIRLGANDAVLVTNKHEMEKYREDLDLIISTIPVAHDISPYIDLLRFRGTLWILGALFPLPDFDTNGLASLNLKLRSSIVGGVEETEEMLDFCSKHHIAADIEVIPIGSVNGTYDRLKKRDVKYRFVIDVDKSL